MCNRDNASTRTGLPAPSSSVIEGLSAAMCAPQSSRRRRLWELPAHSHCPVIGVCLPMPLIRRLIGKALGSEVQADDYDFHVAAVAECARRRPVSEALQRALDSRYAGTLRRFSQAKTTEAVARLWTEAMHGCDIPGALWAALTHPRADEDLRDRICRDIHMFQHQVGACRRADLAQLEHLQDENGELKRELAAAKDKHARVLAQKTRDMERLNSELMQVRAQIIGRDSVIASLRDELEAFRTSVPALDERLDLARRVELQRHRIHDIERSRLQFQRRAEQAEENEQALLREVASLRGQSGDKAERAEEEATGTLASLRDKSVLCVGGRAASVPVYRRLIEVTGGKFLHHDGGGEDSSAQLDANLAAADLVICQAGCISHGAYWRVKDHCKRTGKRCVFVEKPSASSLARCLREIGKDEAEEGMRPAREEQAPA